MQNNMESMVRKRLTKKLQPQRTRCLPCGVDVAPLQHKGNAAYFATELCASRKNMKIFIFLTLLNITACSGLIETTRGVPVMVGGEIEFDACASAAELTFLDKEKVKVYSAPDERSNIRDLISKKILVSVCESSNGWFGIVYSTDENVRCGTGFPIKIRQAYEGPCKSGWVKESNLRGWMG